MATLTLAGPPFSPGIVNVPVTEVSVPAAVASYRHWWAQHFGVVTELAGLAPESNELRYRPFAPGVIVRAGADVSDDELAKALALGSLTGTPVRFSLPSPRPVLAGGAVTVESEEALAASLTGAPDGARLRLLGPTSAGVYEAAAEAGLSVLDEPICSSGRVELVRWLREQVITRSLHRYGNIVYPHW